jgi:hypothetical protein
LELINRPFPLASGSPDEYRRGMERAIANGWLTGIDRAHNPEQTVINVLRISAAVPMKLVTDRPSSTRLCEIHPGRRGPIHLAGRTRRF